MSFVISLAVMGLPIGSAPASTTAAPEVLPNPTTRQKPVPEAPEIPAQRPENRSGTNLTAEEWLEFVRTDVERGHCYAEVMARMGQCRLYDRMITTQGWKSQKPRYRVLMECSRGPFEAYFSAQKSASEEVLSEGELFCEDEWRVWVRLPEEGP